MEQAAASVSALWSGTYKGTRASFAADVWPGDALLLNAPSTNLNAQVVVRTVKVSYSASYPDLVEYEIAFANDWADDLAIKTSATVPADAWLPAPVASDGACQSERSDGDGAERKHGDDQYRSDAARGRRIRDSAAGLCIHAGRGSGRW